MCGIIGVHSPEDGYEVAPYLSMGLLGLQHRGQEAAGAATFDGKKIRCVKGQGTVGEVFTQDKLGYLLGSMGVGHTRYSTTGESELRNAQPIISSYAGGELSIAHNGNLTNSRELRQELEETGHVFVTNTDTEIIAKLIAKRYARNKDMLRSIVETTARLDGAYSFVMITHKSIYAVRDPFGIKPLWMGELDGMTVFASESCALDTLGARFVRDIHPGEIVRIKAGETTFTRLHSPRRAHCMFEYVYFARPDSVLDGREVFETRKRLGRELAKRSNVDADVVIGVPASGMAVAQGFSEGSGIKFSEGLMRNRFVGRSFIMPVQHQRERAVSSKLNPISSEMRGKRVVLMDDSIVRGTTTCRLLRLVHQRGGVKELHMMVSCPPIHYPCLYGVDFPTKKELIANNKEIQEIGKEIGADSLTYQDIDGLVNAIGMRREDLCMACLTGEYPTERGKQVELSSWTNNKKADG
jgi:amidophosphoribosyltransferase